MRQENLCSRRGKIKVLRELSVKEIICDSHLKWTERKNKDEDMSSCKTCSKIR